MKSLVEDRTGKKSAQGKRGSLDGILVVDKPSGWTSHDVVARIRSFFGLRKAGHAGTLDPSATGLLPIGIGQATRITEYLMDLPKAYRVRMKLGEETDTEDASGQVIAKRGLQGLREEQVQAEVMRFQGKILQTPPIYSAIKKNGRRLYDYARKGEDVFPEPRLVTVYAIGDVQSDFPWVSFYVRCSRGTYVRSLCRDMGRGLGVGAHVTELRRVECATFTEQDADPVSEILEMGADKAVSLLVPMDAPLGHLEAVVLGPGNTRKIRQGQPVTIEDLAEPPAEWETGAWVRVYDENQRFVAIGTYGQLSAGCPAILPKKVFC